MMEGRERVVSRLDWNRRPHHLAFSGKALYGRRFNRWRGLYFFLILIIVHKANLISAQVHLWVQIFAVWCHHECVMLKA